MLYVSVEAAHNIARLRSNTVSKSIRAITAIVRPTSSLKPFLLHLGLNVIEIPTLLKPRCIITASFFTVAVLASTDPRYQRFTAFDRLTKRDTCFGYGYSYADACGPGWI
jgi:hypothetical protein